MKRCKKPTTAQKTEAIRAAARVATGGSGLSYSTKRDADSNKAAMDLAIRREIAFTRSLSTR